MCFKILNATIRKKIRCIISKSLKVKNKKTGREGKKKKGKKNKNVSVITININE